MIKLMCFHDKCPIYLNPAHIVWMKREGEESCTKIVTVEDPEGYYAVQETPEDILGMIREESI
ncbi:hypothetical protein [Halomonas huangheensis]|uniref:Uncharacterized protein n=1 Tax=Halomonas huangheensis TaxID=1178482 RepID=W1NCQ0_9GAMM|nr:hypothetical protein [Halomonas huangheensis]ALM52522.1 hypothetical protein AR456_09715 [Halomonas huangheensis]ERL52976.1 hypothetical protein BJB45_16990 [Halomonas huangheensis]